MEGWLITVLLYVRSGTTLPLAAVRLLILRLGLVHPDVGEDVHGPEHGDLVLAVGGRHVEGHRDEVVGLGRVLDPRALPHEEPDVTAGLEGGALDRPAQPQPSVDDTDDDGAALGRLHRGDG